MNEINTSPQEGVKNLYAKFLDTMDDEQLLAEATKVSASPDHSEGPEIGANYMAKHLRMELIEEAKNRRNKR